MWVFVAHLPVLCFLGAKCEPAKTICDNTYDMHDNFWRSQSCHMPGSSDCGIKSAEMTAIKRTCFYSFANKIMRHL